MKVTPDLVESYNNYELKCYFVSFFFQSGNILCEPVECPLVDCRAPITDPGECCPRCDDRKYIDIEYK